MQDPMSITKRIEEVPAACAEALRFFQDNLVWDALLPWHQSNYELIDTMLPRYQSTGVNFVSLTVDDAGPECALEAIAHLHKQVRERSEWLCIARTVPEIEAARRDGVLAVGLGFQETLPFGKNLDNIVVFYELGVRQALLAYNNRNFVGDGCAEPADAGLSLFGRAVVAEMNRVGMLVDGSHSGYRTTMEAMEISSAPFIFSHSNPVGVRPHYRNIKDDQIKACAGTGGVVGINGVGYWCGDNNAPTDAIFRCLDYTVDLVGPEHVGLGFDYIGDIDDLIEWVHRFPIMWPPYEGEWMCKHNYAGPEQMVELVQFMMDRGYPEDAIVAILGGNWKRVASAVWR
jgi:membrane dipeptidase